MGRVDLGDRSYLVDRHRAWMRLVDADDLPLDIDPDALGNTTVELNVPDPRETMASYARVLDLEIVEMLDDHTGYQMLLDDGVLALGGLWYEPQLGRALPTGWIPYFEVADLVGTVASAEDEGVQVVLPPTVEEFDLFSVLVDAWGLTFGFYTYRYRGQAELFVRRDDGEVLAYRDAVRPLVSAPAALGVLPPVGGRPDALGRPVRWSRLGGPRSPGGSIRPRRAPRAGNTAPVRHGQRLLGVELHAERPGEAASFYAWLLGPVSGMEPTDWGPVSLLFEHAVCGVAAVEPGGPPAGWVPVIAVPRLRQVGARAQAEGMRLEQRRGRTYLVDAHGVWTRVVDLESIPPDVDPDALGNTIVDLSLPDPRAAMAPYARLLELEQTRMLDDVTDYQMLLDDGVFALGGVWYGPSSLIRLRAVVAGLLRHPGPRGDRRAGPQGGGLGGGASDQGGLQHPHRAGRSLRDRLRLLHLLRHRGVADAGGACRRPGAAGPRRAAAPGRPAPPGPPHPLTRVAPAPFGGRGASRGRASKPRNDSAGTSLRSRQP